MAQLKAMTIKIDPKELLDEIDSYPKATQKAIVSTINVIGRRGNTMLKKKVKKDYNVTTSVLARNIKVVPAKVRPSFVTNFVIIVKNTPRGLIKYSARETSTGIVAIVERSRRRNIATAFIGNYKKGKFASGAGEFVMIRTRRKHVVRFTPKGTPYTAEKRITLYGLTIAQIYITKPNLKAFDELVEKDFDAVMNEKFNQFAK